MCVCIYIYIYMIVCMCVCVCVCYQTSNNSQVTIFSAINITADTWRDTVPMIFAASPVHISLYMHITMCVRSRIVHTDHIVIRGIP